MSAMPQQRDVAMFELGLRDYGSSWTRLQEALKVQQQLYGPVKQDELPEPSPSARSDDAGEEKAAAKSKSRAGLIGLITRKKDAKKKDKRASKSPDDSLSKSEQPTEDFSLKRPARKELPAVFARALSSEKGAQGEDVPDTPRDKSHSPKSFSGVSENSDERLSIDELRSNDDTGSPGEDVPNGGSKRRQALPVDNGHWGAVNDQSERKNARASERTPRGQKRESPTREKDVDIYARHRKHSFRDFFGEERYDENFSLREPQRRQNEQVHQERPLRQQYNSTEPPYCPPGDDETVTEQSSAKPVDEPEPLRQTREVDRIVYPRGPAEPPTRQPLMRPLSESEPHRPSREADRGGYRRDGEARRVHSLTRTNGDVEPHRPSREAERASHRREERETARGHSLTRPASDAEPHRPAREVDRYRRGDVEAQVERLPARSSGESGPRRPSREADRAGYRREQAPRGHSQTRPPAEPEPHRPPREADRASSMHCREPSPYRPEVDDGRGEQPVQPVSAHYSERRMRRQDGMENVPREEPQGRLREYGLFERSNGRLNSNSYKNRQQTDQDRANNDRQLQTFRDDAREKNKDHDDWEDRDGRQQRREGRAEQEPAHAAPESARPQGCTRCGDRVYPKEMVTPKPGVLLHSGCFKCRECGVKLTLQTFFTNQRDTRDTDVYCRTHVPRLGPGTVDGNALNILTSKNSREIKFSRYPKTSDSDSTSNMASQDDG